MISSSANVFIIKVYARLWIKQQLWQSGCWGYSSAILACDQAGEWQQALLLLSALGQLVEMSWPIGLYYWRTTFEIFVILNQCKTFEKSQVSALGGTICVCVLPPEVTFSKCACRRDKLKLCNLVLHKPVGSNPQKLDGTVQTRLTFARFFFDTSKTCKRLSKCSQWCGFSSWVFFGLVEQSGQVNVITYSSAINACAKQTKWQEAALLGCRANSEHQLHRIVFCLRV